MTDPVVNGRPTPGPRRPGKPKGYPKTGGRRAGTPNKVNGSIHDMMKALGCDPRMVLARICMNAQNPAELRRKAASDLMGFMYPRLNSVDTHVTGETQTIVQIISGIARLPTDPIDVTPTPPDNSGSPSTPESVTGSETPGALPPGRPRHPSSSPSDAPRPALPSSDPLADDNLDRTRAADAKVAELNSRAGRFIA
jgi:hypothetical protein